LTELEIFANCFLQKKEERYAIIIQLRIKI